MLFWHWLTVHLSQETGTSNEVSRAYAFWSGFGSDIGEVTVFAGFIALYHHMKCSSCPRIGIHKMDTGQKTCHRHSTHAHHAGLRVKHREKYPDHIAHNSEGL